MPLSEGTRYRVVTTKTGKKVRLAFKKGTNQVIEHKGMPKLTTDYSGPSDRPKGAEDKKKGK